MNWRSNRIIVSGSIEKGAGIHEEKCIAIEPGKAIMVIEKE